jgi:hypothetical protein
VLIVLHFLETLLEFYNPIKFWYDGGIEKQFNASALDFYVYSFKTIVETSLGLGFLYIGYVLAQKLFRNSSSRNVT